jgi:BirA family biotin operon repressor/biotin-[acetyl-CoA-carboxylase] ligase
MGDEPANQVGWRLHRFRTIDSTNRWLLDEARAGAPAGLVAIADHQTEGRGRRGRAWVAPPGSSLLVSVLVRPDLTVERVHLVTMAAALATRDAVHEVAGVWADVKWPNDLVVADRKLAGLLAEADLSGRGEVRAVVIGIGCNVQWDDVPDELAGIATACNIEAGRPVERAPLLDVLLDRLTARLGALDAVAAEYRAALGTLGRRVRVDLVDREIEGTATDVDDAGRLVVTAHTGQPHVIAVGDVVHLRTV